MTRNENFEGAHCLVYQPTEIPTQSKSESTVYTTVWIRASDRMPVKVLLAWETGRILYMFEFSDFDKEITIQAPIT